MTEAAMSGDQAKEQEDRLDRLVTRIMYIAAGLVAVACITLVYHKIVGGSDDDFDDDVLLEAPQVVSSWKEPIKELELEPWTHDRVANHFQLSSMAQIRWSQPVLTEEQLTAALSDASHVVEVPLVHAGEEHMLGPEPVVAWNATDWRPWDHMTFKRVLELWIDSRTTKGLMLTVLDPRVGRIALGKARVFQKFGKLTGPVFLGAELLPGPGMSPPSMERIPVPSHISEAFRQAVPELQDSGLNPHPKLSADEQAFLPFDPVLFLRECQAAMPGAFLIASWSLSIPCPKNYMPPPGRRLLRKRGKKVLPAEHYRYTANHMQRMKQTIEDSAWDGGVALAVDVCHIGKDTPIWQNGLLAHNGQIPLKGSASYKVAQPWQLEPWLIMMRGTMTEPAGQSLRSAFNPHALLLNVSDVHGVRIVL